MKKYYTTTEISNLLGVTTASINTWINSGELKSFKTPGGHNRIRSDILLNFLNKNKIPIPPELDTGNKPRILIVEDDEDVREFVLAAIDDIDYDVEIELAKDGYSAGNKVIKFKPDIIILDIMLPGINGFEICKQIRGELGASVKVLAMTGYFSEESKRKIMAAGADAFMRKPMMLEELKEQICKFIETFADKYYLTKKEVNETKVASE